MTSYRDIPQYIGEGSYAVDYPISHLPSYIGSEIDECGLELNPDFQRGHVWTDEQQIAYMEHLLRGGRTGRDLYFNMPTRKLTRIDHSYNSYVCVDGLQRITAICRYFNNEIAVFGHYAREYTDKCRMTNTVRVHINELQSKKDVLRWYLQMNAGGTPHSKEELERVREMIKTSYAEMYESVFTSGKCKGKIEQIGRLAQYVFWNSEKGKTKDDCVYEAHDLYESMTGSYFDPTQEQFDDIRAEITG